MVANMGLNSIFEQHVLDALCSAFGSALATTLEHESWAIEAGSEPWDVLTKVDRMRGWLGDELYRPEVHGEGVNEIEPADVTDEMIAIAIRLEETSGCRLPDLVTDACCSETLPLPAERLRAVEVRSCPWRPSSGTQGCLTLIR